MQPSTMQALEQFEAPAPAKAQKDRLPLLSLITFLPMGNPLTDLSPAQCSLFFDYLLMSLHNQRKEYAERVALLNKKITLPASLSAMAIGMQKKQDEGKAREAALSKGKEAKLQQEAMIAEKGGSGAAAGGGTAGAAPGTSVIKFTSLIRKREEGGEKGAGARGFGPSFFPSFGQKAPAVSSAIWQLSPVVDDYARGDVATGKKIVDSLHSSMRASGYRTDDIMASLLMVIEDDAWSGEEGSAGGAKPHGGATRLAALVPQRLRSSAEDSAQVRLASVREMLRYYFLAHPKDYHVALAAALGMASDDAEDAAFIQERLAAMLANIGSFALAQKILAELKRKRKMGTSECLMRLGYRYDAKKKRLILGKRTCGRPAEARGIVDLIISSAKK